MDAKTYFQIYSTGDCPQGIAIIEKDKFQDFITSYKEGLHKYYLETDKESGYKSLEHTVNWIRTKPTLFAQLTITALYDDGDFRSFNIEMEERKLNEFQITEEIIKL